MELNEIFIVVLLLILSAFFSASELAIMTVPFYKIKQLVSSNWKLIKFLYKLRQNSERTLITILIGNNLVNVILSIYASGLGDSILKGFAITGAIWLMIVSFSITFLILLFWEIIPKVFATKFSLNLALLVSPIIYFLQYLLFPFVFILELIVKLFNRLLSKSEDRVSKEDIEVFIEDWQKQWLFSSIESKIIKNFLEFNERGVESVLRHRTEVFALPVNMKLKEAIKKVLEKPYSRIPVYEQDKDNIIWIITLRDILKYSQNVDNLEKTLWELKLKPVFRVPVTANIFDIFMKMKKTWHHFAVVLDEYWGTEGIVTFEDILEDMVGDIKDESDIAEEKQIIKINNNQLIVSWDVLLREVLDELDIWEINIEDEDFSEDDMISYIILEKLKRFAKNGDKIVIWNLVFEVVEIDPKKNKILKVKVYKNVTNSN